MFKNQRYHEIANAVGQVCISWSDLEWRIAMLASRISKRIAPEYHDSRVSFPFELAFSCMDIREKIKLTKILAHTVGGDTTFYDDVCATLNAIDNDLRPERNRYVHDHWIAGSGADVTLRIQHAPKIIKPEAFKTEMNRRTVQKFGDTDEIFELARRIDGAQKEVIALEGRTGTLPLLEELPSK